MHMEYLSRFLIELFDFMLEFIFGNMSLKFHCTSYDANYMKWLMPKPDLLGLFEAR
jgi:hypothetical protein